MATCVKCGAKVGCSCKLNKDGLCSYCAGSKTKK